MRTAAFLRNVPVLAGLSDELLERLARQVNDVRVRAGTWIMREGKSADSMFIVRSGRLEVCARPDAGDRGKARREPRAGRCRDTAQDDRGSRTGSCCAYRPGRGHPR